jgi:glycosyltransferase involved in cell wall biosynthesis
VDRSIDGPEPYVQTNYFLKSQYGIKSKTIAYGGDTYIFNRSDLIKSYILFVCRIEPENNIDTVLNAVSKSKYNGIFVANWGSSKYIMAIRNQYDGKYGISCMDPVYDPNQLSRLRSECSIYIHGHSAGGTNPSLVEIMFYGKEIIANYCDFNRFTLGGYGHYFKNANDILSILENINIVSFNQEIVNFAYANYS